ncbi:hypothetical protein TNCV_5137261 [Trichonephila clavipes]|nr:hypothetical protein TNCV_5137261 [Trichonephila clavipes]
MLLISNEMGTIFRLMRFRLKRISQYLYAIRVVLRLINVALKSNMRTSGDENHYFNVSLKSNKRTSGDENHYFNVILRSNKRTSGDENDYFSVTVRRKMRTSGDENHYFKSWSNDKDDTCVAPFLSPHHVRLRT